MLRNLLRSSTASSRAERGATAVEYGLIAAVVALGILGSVTSTRQGIVNAFNAVSGQLTDVAGAPSNPGSGEACANGTFTQSDADALNAVGAVVSSGLMVEGPFGPDLDWRSSPLSPSEYCAAVIVALGAAVGGSPLTSIPEAVWKLRKRGV